MSVCDWAELILLVDYPDLVLGLSAFQSGLPITLGGVVRWAGEIHTVRVP